MLNKLVELTANPEFTAAIFVIVLAFKNQDASGFESSTISRYLTRAALSYIQKASSEDIEELMMNFLTEGEWKSKKDKWDL